MDEVGGGGGGGGKTGAAAADFTDGEPADDADFSAAGKGRMKLVLNSLKKADEDIVAVHKGCL